MAHSFNPRIINKYHRRNHRRWTKHSTIYRWPGLSSIQRTTLPWNGHGRITIPENSRQTISTQTKIHHHILRPGRKSTRCENTSLTEPCHSPTEIPSKPKHPTNSESNWNVKGLTYSSWGKDYKHYLNCLRELQVDIAGITPWQLYHIRTEFLTRARKYHPITKVVFGGLSKEIDPMDSKKRFQAEEIC